MTVPHHSESLRPFLSYFYLVKGLGNRTIYKQNNMLICQQVIRQVPSRGVLVVLSPVFLVSAEVVLIVLVRVLMVTCVAVVACSHRPRFGAVGIGKSTLTRSATLYARLLLLPASLPWWCPKVTIFTIYCHNDLRMMNIVFPVFLIIMNEPKSPWNSFMLVWLSYSSTAINI